MRKKTLFLIAAIALLRVVYIGGQAVRFYGGDIRVPLLVGKQRNEVEGLLGKSVQQRAVDGASVCLYSHRRCTVMVRYSRDDKAVFLQNPDFAD